MQMKNMQNHLRSINDKLYFKKIWSACFAIYHNVQINAILINSILFRMENVLLIANDPFVLSNEYTIFVTYPNMILLSEAFFITR